MSHELRTPLNAIIGLTEMMTANATRFGTEKAQEPLRRVHRAGTHLLGLINQVLDLSKIEAGKLELNPESVMLAPLVDEVIGTARQLAPARGHLDNVWRGGSMCKGLATQREAGRPRAVRRVERAGHQLAVGPTASGLGRRPALQVGNRLLAIVEDESAAA